MPTIELINTGSELLLGFIVNTHASYMAQKLAALNLEITRQVCVGDDPSALRSAFVDALGRADIILATGGLGPTKDDLTRDIVAELTGRKQLFDAAIMGAIERRFAGRQMPESVRVQAMIPEGARVLPNANGTAPGLALEYKGKLIILLPGPPRELKPMFEDEVLPLLRQWCPGEARECRTLRVAGLGESVIEEQVIEATRGLEDLELGYCARMGEVDVRIITRGAQATARADVAEERIRQKLGVRIFGTATDSMEGVVVRMLTELKQTLATAESCTGGLIANRVTNVSGSSAVFLGGIVAYANAVKIAQAGVNEATLAQHGAVSEAVARELATGARRRLGADFGIGVTGIAGPTGGTPEKPVGLVFYALATPARVVCQRQVFQLDRETFKFIVSQNALDLLRRELLGAV